MEELEITLEQEDNSEKLINLEKEYGHITIDEEPTINSKNAVSSGGVFEELEDIKNEYATKEYVDEVIGNAEVDVDLSDYATKNYVDENLEKAIPVKGVDYFTEEDIASLNIPVTENNYTTIDKEKVNVLNIAGTGANFLADDGTYKEITTGGGSTESSEDTVIFYAPVNLSGSNGMLSATTTVKQKIPPVLNEIYQAYSKDSSKKYYMIFSIVNNPVVGIVTNCSTSETNFYIYYLDNQSRLYNKLRISTASTSGVINNISSMTMTLSRTLATTSNLDNYATKEYVDNAVSSGGGSSGAVPQRVLLYDGGGSFSMSAGNITLNDNWNNYDSLEIIYEADWLGGLKSTGIIPAGEPIRLTGFISDSDGLCYLSRMIRTESDNQMYVEQAFKMPTTTTPDNPIEMQTDEGVAPRFIYGYKNLTQQ